MKKLLIISSIVLLSCNNEQPKDDVETSTIEESSSNVAFSTIDSVTKSFVIPDSINTTLIIATYVEIDPQSHTLIVYSGDDKKKAVLVRYLEEGGLTTENLDVISEDLLRSANGSEFQIKESTVIYKTAEGQTKEHFRTDSNY